MLEKKKHAYLIAYFFLAIEILISPSNSFAVINIANDTLAIIGSKTISSDAFKKVYKEKLVKLGLTDTYDLRNKYLQNLVTDQLLIQEAKLQGFEKGLEALAEKKQIETQALLNLYSDKKISSNIKVTPVDLKQLFIKTNTKLQVSHLFASTKEEANLLVKRINKGESFESLAKEIFNDPHLKENSGSLGFISADDMDGEFEKAAYKLKVGEISAPVKTVYGYSIIRLDDIKQNPFLTETEYARQQDKLKSLARKRKFEEAAKELTSSLRLKLKIKFSSDLITKLFIAIKLDSNKSQLETTEFSRINMEKTVVTFSKGKWSLGEVINHLESVKEKQRKWIRTSENLEDFLAGLIIREHIIKQAEVEGLDETPKYAAYVNENYDTYLLTKMEELIHGEIKIPEDSVKTYYDKNRKLFINPARIRLSSILINSKPLSDSIQNMLKSGKRFEVVARKYSIQKMSAENGGDIGLFKKEELQNLGNELFSMKMGEVKGPFIDHDKYLFLKCTAKYEATEKPYQEVEPEISKVLKSFEWYSRRTKYAESLKSKIPCKIFFNKLTEIKIY